MFGANDLKPSIAVTASGVECPIKGCSYWARRESGKIVRADQCKCPAHKIYLSATTFEHDDYHDNLLWTDTADTEILDEIMKVKRESRMARDNSEDAVTWNVFRYLEKQDLIGPALKELLGITITNPTVIYWSFSQSTSGTWPPLSKGRKTFDYDPSRGSEPDIIILGEETLVFVEAKMLAGNRTKPRNKSVKEKYETGGNKWWNQAFQSSFDRVAVKEKRYELARFWLLGTWLAKQQNLNFHLVSLVLEGRDRNLESDFRPFLAPNLGGYHRLSWEQIYRFVLSTGRPSNNHRIMCDYFRHKTVGYHGRKLKKAFKIV